MFAQRESPGLARRRFQEEAGRTHGLCSTEVQADLERWNSEANAIGHEFAGILFEEVGLAAQNVKTKTSDSVRSGRLDHPVRILHSSGLYGLTVSMNPAKDLGFGLMAGLIDSPSPVAVRGWGARVGPRTAYFPGQRLSQIEFR